MKRFDTAVKLGPMAVLRVRAEVALECADGGTFTISDEERQVLDHIAVAADESDREFLKYYDRYYEAMEDGDE
jgi:hypothetical protein